MKHETLLQTHLLLVAPEHLPSLRLFRRNIATANMRGYKVQFGIPGQCDLYGLLRGGRHLEIELKSATGSLKPDQKAWRAWCIEWGITHLVLKAQKEETIEETVERWVVELSVLVVR
jgi:hypothetical protein